MTEPDPMLPDPADDRLMLQALADGELDAAAALALERRLAAAPALKAEYERIIALKRRVGGLPRPAVTEGFATRMETLAGAGAAPSTRPSRSFDWRALAASIIVTAAIASGATYLALKPEARPGVAEAVAMSHRRALLAASPVDIASADRHRVKPWLDAKLGISPPTADLAGDGFPLVGGRVDVIADQPVPSLVYRRGEHLISLVAMPRAPGETATAAAQPLAAGGLIMARWTEGAYAYWAVSDLQRPELDRFVQRFRAGAAN
ncbi:anti-sigma factor family protein [Phreatobacter stygius]|uniref:Anti-sigma factor n=1 Tax=Phreatobacter stygius TaxID=1940610 RepID=A0A4D7B7P7_9HYPH|nr:anti-sigma factor [Phreatobacter stygius]QCI66903.1 anti-sigma factor [Phreatobacter stygius]